MPMFFHNHKIRIFLLLLVTFAVYSFSLSNTFVNWDDYVYIVDNADVHSLSVESLRHFFTKSYNNTYIPLTMLTWSLEYAVAGEYPALFILNNILLHLACVYLVYIISNLLFRNNTKAFIIAAVFALHPVHVESVVWVTERKDVLYAFFFFLSLWFYIKDALSKQKGRLFYFYALLFFVLSLFSKGQAVVLSAVVVIVDIYLRKDWLKRKLIIEKIPFFALSLIFGLLALYFQGYSKGGTVMYEFNLTDRFFISSAAFVNYIIASLFPFALSPVNPLPNPGGALPVWYYLAGCSVPLYLMLMLYAWKKNKNLFFGLSVFFVAILMMLDHTRVGRVLFADRFLYVSIFGFAVLVAGLYERLIDMFNPKIINVAGLLLLVLISLKTYSQTRIWENSETLFSYAVKLNDNNPVALCNYASALADKKDFDKALEYYNKSVKAFPGYSDAYNDRGTLFYNYKKYEQALDDYNIAINLVSSEPHYLSNRGRTYYILNQLDLAKRDFAAALKKDPDNLRAISGMSLYLTKTGDYSKAKAYINKMLKIDPKSHDAYYNLANNYLEQGFFNEAINNLNKAVDLKNDVGLYYRLRGEIKGRYMNDLDGSLNDLNKAVELDNNDYIAYNNIGLLNVMQGNVETAEEMFKKSLSIRPFYCEALINYALLNKMLNRIEESEKYYKLATEKKCGSTPK